MGRSTTTRRGGMSLLGVLLVVFATLKLAGVVAWSWVWVLAPLWIGMLLTVLIFLLIVGALALAASAEDRARDRIEAAERAGRARAADRAWSPGR